MTVHGHTFSLRGRSLRTAPKCLNDIFGSLRQVSPCYRADLEIVGQPVSEADRKFLTLQKVLGASSFLSKLFLKVLKTMIISARKYDMS